MKKICIFISDEGYGHIIRQSSIIKILLKKNYKITVVTSRKIKILKEKFGNQISYDNYHNNIETIKNVNGSLNIRRTKKVFLNWKKKSPFWIARNLKKYKNQNLFISDFVPDAFKLAEILGIPCIGVAHFTWDWFYGKIYNKFDPTFVYLKDLISKATSLYFPPLTPASILKKLRQKIKKINFILTDFTFEKVKIKKITVLLMDNGTNSLKHLIIKTIPYLAKIKKYNFIIRVDNLNKASKNIIINSSNITTVTGLKKMHSKILEADIVIARGGFNTISECLSLKKPCLLFNEKNNPEIGENIKNIENKNYGKLINTNEWKKNFEKTLNIFYHHEYNKIKANLEKANFKTNGSQQICCDIDTYLYS